MRQLVCIVVGVALFLAGRHLHSRRRNFAPGEASAQAAVATEPSAAAGRAGDSRSLAQLNSALTIGLSNMSKQDSSRRTREAMRTIEEPEAFRAARHRALNREIDEKYPALTTEKRDFLLAVNDQLESDRRRQRAAFMVNARSEDDYIAELKSAARASFDECRKKLTREEFQKLMGHNPESDPFDPTGVYIDPKAPLPMRMTPIDQLPTGDSPVDPAQMKQSSP